MEKPPILRESVREALRHYFERLEDETATGLYDLVMTEVEVPLLQCVLEETGNNQSRTAHILGINRGTLRRKLAKYGML